MPRDAQREADLQLIISKARENRLGVLLFAVHPAAGLGLEKSVNLWVTDRSPDWPLKMELGDLDLCILMAYLLKRNWAGATLTLITVVSDAGQSSEAKDFLSRLVELARLPKDTRIHVANGEFRTYLSQAPQADLNVFGLPPEVDFAFIRSTLDETGASCAFLLASGEESALA